MRKNKNTMPEGKSNNEIADFWDKNSISAYWQYTKPARFDVEIKSEQSYFIFDAKLSKRVVTIARKRRVSPKRLLNKWIEEKVSQESY